MMFLISLHCCEHSAGIQPHQEVEAQMERHYLVENEGKLKWCDHGTCFVLEDDDNLHEHLKVIYSILVTVHSYFVLVKMP
jgi:hypothetical protein